MTEITLTPDKTRLLYAKTVDGKPVCAARFDPMSANNQKDVARLLDVPVDQLLQWIAQTKQAGVGQVFSVQPVSSELEEFMIRGMSQKREQGAGHTCSPEDALYKLLPQIPVDTLLDWPSLSRLCCLDIDYHGFPAPPEEWLAGIVQSRLSPTPLVWHLSRSGGLHLFYTAAEGFTADELAAAAALRFRCSDASAGLELKKCVRGPGSAQLHYFAQQDTTVSWAAWVDKDGVFDVQERDDWLESRGMSLDSRYNHDHCPIHKSEDLGEKRTPVCVGEDGIFCFVCEGKGRSLGCRRPGFAPWSAVLGSSTSGDLGRMVRRLCHWGHAKHVLSAKYQLSGSLAELGYRAGLKAYHADKTSRALVPNVFNDKLDKYARTREDWFNLYDGTAYDSRINAVIGSMPVAQYVNDKGAIKSDPAMVQHMLQPITLTEFGYPPLTIIHGMQLTAPHQITPPEQILVSRAAVHVVERGDRFLPRYIPKSERTDADTAWARLNTLLPGVDRRFITALLVSAGITQETRSFNTPMFFVAGPSGVGKTAHVHVAGTILGTGVSEPQYSQNDERFRQGLMDAVKKTPFVVVNEIFKDACRGYKKMTPTQALDPLLSFTPESTSWVAYTGNRRLDRVPVMVYTEILLPEEIREQTQIARRLRYYQIDHLKDTWKPNLSANGISDIKFIRTHSTDWADVCNTILSDIIDTYFSAPEMLDKMLDQIGVKTVECSLDFDDPTPTLRRFFRLVCLTPEIQNAATKKRYGRGYKQITRGDLDTESLAYELLVTYTSYTEQGEWFSSRKLQEKDWGRVLGTDQPVRLSIRGDNTSSVFVRFQVGPVQRPSAVNEEIVDPSSWE